MKTKRETHVKYVYPGGEHRGTASIYLVGTLVSRVGGGGAAMGCVCWLFVRYGNAMNEGVRRDERDRDVPDS